MRVDLSEQEWVALINVVALGPYKDVNPLMQKISQQLMAQKANEERVAEMRSKHEEERANKIEETSAPPKRARN